MVTRRSKAAAPPKRESSYRILLRPEPEGGYTVHAMTKKTQKLKPKDIELAEARILDVQRRLQREGASPIRQRTNQA